MGKRKERERGMEGEREIGGRGKINN
jgi:hypothetical protein